MDYFVEEDFNAVRSQRRKCLLIYLLIALVYLGCTIASLVCYSLLPYQSDQRSTVKLVHYAVSAVFIIFSFIYLGIIFRRVNKFYKVTFNMVEGHKETSVGSFFEYDEKIQYRDGVEFKSLVFIEWNKYKNDFFERKVLVFYEKPFPQLELKQNVKYVTQNNVLISYEILQSEEEIK